MRATLNRKGGIHQGVVVRLIHKVETYNSETQVSHILLEGTVGSYAPLGTSEFEKHVSTQAITTSSSWDVQSTNVLKNIGWRQLPQSKIDHIQYSRRSNCFQDFGEAKRAGDASAKVGGTACTYSSQCINVTQNTPTNLPLFLVYFVTQLLAGVHVGMCEWSGAEVSFQWKNPDLLLKNPDFLFRNPDFPF